MLIEVDTKDHSTWPSQRVSPGQLAYEADCAAMPLYHDGTVRRAWHDLADYAKHSWEKNPTQR